MDVILKYTVFYYHTDHLGSASYITDEMANVVQQIAYLPYGEDWIDVRSNGFFGSAYKFNGKEKDDETGYNYYGARYYTDRLSVWLSVDPLADKYPSLSGYNYCANNPMMFVDPNGKEYKYHIYKDKEGNWRMDINSTIHVYSDKGNTAAKVREYNQFMNDNASKFRGQYTHKDGTSVTISININFVVGEEDGNLPKGDNRLFLESNAKRGRDMGAYNDGERLGNKAVMDSEGDYYSSPATVVHDILHLMGLGDRYGDDSNYSGKNIWFAKGFENDIMGGGPITEYNRDGFSVNQEHFNNYGKANFKKSEIKGIGNKVVDKATIQNPEIK